MFLIPLVYLSGSYLLARPINEEVHTMNDITLLALRLFFEISLSLLFMHFAKFIVVILLSPVLNHLSVKTERILSGVSYPFDAAQFMKDIANALYIACRNLIWQYVLILIIVIVSLLIWGKVSHSPLSILIYVITAYYYGFSFMDYSLERRKLDLQQRISFVRRHRGIAFSIGTFYSLLIFVPVDIGMIFTGKGFQAEGFVNSMTHFLLHISLLIAACLAPIVAIVSSGIAMQEVLPKRKR